MKKRGIFIMLMSVTLMLSFAACGRQEIENSKVKETMVLNKDDSTEDDVKIVESVNEIIDTKDETQEKELNLTEYEQSYEDRSIGLIGKSILETMDYENFVESWKLTDSVDIYLDADICIGYTKPNIEVTTSKRYAGWYSINVGDKVRYVKADEIEAVADVVDYSRTEENTVADVTTQNAPATEKNAVSEPAVSTPVEAPLL